MPAPKLNAALKAAEEILARIKTPEAAAALKGSERQAYLDALTQAFGSRESRAAEMGFDLGRPQYHGTRADFGEFKVPKDPVAAKYGLGVYSTPNPSLASGYAMQGQGGSVMPLVTAGKRFDSESPAAVDAVLSQMGLPNKPLRRSLERFSDDGRNNLNRIVQNNRTIDPAANKESVIRSLEKAGYSGVDVPSEQIAMTIDPSSIRSKFAAFDPRFKDSANLLATATGAALVGSMLTPEDSQASTATDAAKLLLEKIKTPEMAVALKGPEREAYLKALDEAFGPRVQRAKEAGYDFSERFYHGSPNKPFDSFDLSKLGKTSDHQSAQLGVWVSPDREVAENYTFKNGKKSKSGHIRELVGRFENPETVDFSDLSAETDYLPTEDIQNFLRPRKEIDALTIKGAPGETMFTNPEGRSDVTLVRKPEMLRDTKAAFDPRFADSPYLMAGVAPVAAMTAKNTKTPDQYLGDAYDLYQDNVVTPLSDLAKRVFTPKVSAAGKAYDTSSGVSDFVLDTASNPINYLDGPVGAAVSLADLALGSRKRGR